MNVLVAGAAGALGRVVIDALTQSGHSVRALIRNTPIPDVDVAMICLEAIEGGAQEKEMEVGGPEVFTRKQIAELACEVQGRPVRLRKMPVSIARLSSLLLRPLHPRLSDLAAFYATVWTHDLVAAAFGKRRLCDFFAEVARRS